MKCPQIIRRALAGVLAGIIVATSVPQSAMAATAKSSQEIVDEDFELEEETDAETDDEITSDEDEDLHVEDSAIDKKDSKKSIELDDERDKSNLDGTDEKEETDDSEIEDDEFISGAKEDAKKDSQKSISKDAEESDDEDATEDENEDTETNVEEESELVFPTGGLMELEGIEIPLSEIEGDVTEVSEVIAEVEDELGVSMEESEEAEAMIVCAVEEMYHDSWAYRGDAWDVYSSYYAYNHLDTERKVIWNELQEQCYEALTTNKNYTKKISDGTYYIEPVGCTGVFESQAEMLEFINMFRYSNPQFFFTRGCVYSGTDYIGVTIYQSMADGASRQSAVNEFEDGIKDCKSHINYANDESVVRSIHDTICDRVVYNTESTDVAYCDGKHTHTNEETEYTQSAYSVFVPQKEVYERYSHVGEYATVCAGYAMATSLLANSAGIECMAVTSPGHAYDKICVDDVWYNIDTTWADQRSGIYYGYYLKSDTSDAYNPSIEPSHGIDKIWKNHVPTCTHSSEHPGGYLWDYPTITAPTSKTPAPGITVRRNDSKIKVTIDIPDGADVYYTTGTDEASTASPASSYSKSYIYSSGNEGILIDAGTVVKAIATKDGYWNSDITTYIPAKLGKTVAASYDETENILTISGKGATYDDFNASNPLLNEGYLDNPETLKIVVGSGVTSLGKDLLYVEDKPLEYASLTLPSTVTRLDENSIGYPDTLTLNNVRLSAGDNYVFTDAGTDDVWLYGYDALSGTRVYDYANGGKQVQYESERVEITGQLIKQLKYSGTFEKCKFAILCGKTTKEGDDFDFPTWVRIEDGQIHIPDYYKPKIASGREFKGWNTKADRSGMWIQPGDSLPAEAIGIEKSGDYSYKLYAQIDACYVISFNANGGKIEGASSKTVCESDGYGALPVATRTGYGFEGWYTAATGGEVVPSDSPLQMTKNHTLYAHWMPNAHTISFDANGGMTVDPLATHYDAKYGELPIPTRLGYTFAGWYTAATGGTKVSATTVCKGDTTLYARWTVKKLKLTYDYNEGENSRTIVKDVNYGAKIGDLPIIALPGYDFDGWFTERSGGEEVSRDTLYEGSEALVFYAHWSAREYTITYNVNCEDEVAEPENDAARMGEIVTIDKVLDDRANYTFDGWALDKDGRNKITESIKCSGYVILYAIWEPKQYKVSYSEGLADKNVTYGKKLGELSVPTKSGFVFTGWYTGTDTRVTSDTICTGNIVLTAHWVEESTVGGVKSQKDLEEIYENGGTIPGENSLWIAGVPSSVDYTGSAVTFPDMHVYWDNKILLSENKDYTVKYANNTKAGEAKITVTGKGNYAGTITKTFYINKLSLGTGDIEAATATSNDIKNAANLSAVDITLAYAKNKVQKGATTVAFELNGKYVTLKSGTDFTFVYPDTDSKKAGYSKEAFSNPGKYKVIIQGKGNYEGVATFAEVITDDANLKQVSKLSVSIPAQNATGEPVEATGMVVKDGKVVLTEGIDYRVEYQNNILPGTATAIVVGTGEKYVGTKITTFKINGIAISKATVSGIVATMPFTNAQVEQNSYSLTYKKDRNTPAEILEEGADYTVTYKNNVKAGTATITFTGINRFTGTLNKTYKIVAHVFEADELEFAVVDGISPSTSTRDNIPGYEGVEVPVYIYQKGATKPAVVVTYKASNGASADVVLTEGVDYTVSYAKNTTVNEGGYDKKGKPLTLPTVKITGKGNYSKTVEKSFVIVGSDLSNTTMTATDIVYAKKANICKPTITLYDSNGTKLAAGTDYDNKNIVYTYVDTTMVTQINNKVEGTVKRNAGDTVDLVKDIIPAGTKIKVTVTAKGNYFTNDSEKDHKSATFRIVGANISNTTVKIPDQVFTGFDVEPSVNDIKVTVGSGKNLIELFGEGNTVSETVSYKIVNYENNKYKGTAKLTIQGVGNYGGTKTVNFKIVAKSMNYQITYDSNNGYMKTENPDVQNATGTMKVSTTASGAKLSGCSYKRNGYKFIGWNTKTDGTGDAYADKGVFNIGSDLNSYTTRIYGGNVTLYAQWEPLSYKITYSGAVDGKNGVENTNPTSYTVGTGVPSFAGPTRDGYTFGGWFSDSRCSVGKEITEIGKSTFGNLTIYAKWIKNL